MTFKPGDKVLIDGKGPFTLEYNANSRNYPLIADGQTFTINGRFNTADSFTRLTPYQPTDTSVITYSLGKVQTLDNGIQIYHPNEGQPFQLIPTTKALI